MKCSKICSLRKGTIIIGWLTFIIGIIGLLVFSVILSSPEIYKNYLENFHDRSFTPSEENIFRKELFFYFIWSVIFLLSSIFPLLGTTKERRFLILSWVIQFSLGPILFFTCYLLTAPPVGHILVASVWFALELFLIFVIINVFHGVNKKGSSKEEIV